MVLFKYNTYSNSITMKKLFFISLTALLLSLLAFGKDRSRKVMVVRDCTGTYLNFDGKDHLVCNPEKVVSFANGAKAMATFSKIKVCNGSAMRAIVCDMDHRHAGWVEVEKIK